MNNRPEPPGTDSPSPPSVAGSRRRWFRLSLRGLMVLVLIVGGGVGWLAATIETRRAAVRAVLEAGGHVEDDYWADVPQHGDSWLTRGRRTAERWVTAAVGHDLFRNVVKVWSAEPVGPAALVPLDRFSKLEALSLKDVTRIGDGWKFLQRLERLRSVELTGPGLDTTALVAVAQLRGLQVLRLDDASAADAGFAALATLPALDELTLRACPNLTEAGASSLVAGLPALRMLRLSSLDSRAVSAIVQSLPEHHPGLEVLDIRAVTLSPADLAAIARLPRLAVLKFGGVALGDRGLDALGTLPAVGELTLDGAGVGDEGLALLARLPALWSLGLAGPEITDAGLAALERLPLNRLTLSRLPTVSDAGMSSIAHLAQVEFLTLNLPQLTDAGLVPIRALPRLRSLSLTSTGVTQAGIGAMLPGHPDLVVTSSVASARGTIVTPILPPIP